MIRSTRMILLTSAVCVLLCSPLALAQNDQVFVNGSNKAQRGAITTVTKDGVQLKVGSNVKPILAGSISKIIYSGDPSELVKAREFAIDGQYEQAIEELDNLDISKVKRPEAKADASFYMMLSKAKLALAGRGDKTAAGKMALAFAGGNGSSWHLYESAKILGDLELAQNNPAKALTYYGQLAKSKSIETKIESVYLTGMAKLKQGQAGAAIADFDKIIGIKADTVAKQRLQTLSKAGKAVGLARDGKGAEGLKLVSTLIAELSPTDVEMAARIYNAQGASYEASEDIEGAIIAYLHTHLMFSTQPDAHAEALTRLVALWPQVGKPERGAEARQELQQRYPGYGK